MFDSTSKKILLGTLVACFAVQTLLVYTDEPTGPLSESAIRGRRIFHGKACQVCHQFYGQGGFLGPDLTNAASRVDDHRLASLLTVGSGQMPAFGLSEGQIADVRAFLVEMDRPDLGRGQLRLGDPATATTPQALFEVAVEGAAPPPPARAGFEAFRRGICSTCHFPFQTSPVGAPDLSTAVERLDEAGLRLVLTEGRPLRGMPPPTPAFTEEEREQVLAYLRWLNTRRTELEEEVGRRAVGRSLDWGRLPWWEFR
jgi:nitric oxide reductase subunit C